MTDPMTPPARRMRSLEELVTRGSSFPWEAKVTFLTGATGFLGSHFLFWRRQLGGRQVSLIRGTDRAQAADRLRETLDGCAASYRLAHRHEHEDPASTVVLGDITLPFCGVHADEIEQLKELGVDQFWHFAASLNYEERKRAHIEELNIKGVRNALDLAHALGARRLLYVSTAYTVGCHLGVVPEALHSRGREFNNFYEESKCEAEHIVSSACGASGLDYRILRPSIVLGPSHTLQPGGTDSGLYGFARVIRGLKPALDALDHEVRIDGDAEAPVHFIAVDHVVRDMLHLVEHDFPGGPIHHLTSTGGVSAACVVRTVCEEVGARTIGVGRRDPGVRSPLEVMLDRRAGFYHSYLRDPKEFARSLPAGVALSEEEIRGYVRAYLRKLESATPVDLFQRAVVRSFDGSNLACYEGGQLEKPALVFINAFGMPVDFFLPMAQRLEDRYRLLTWESRGVPSLSRDFDPERAGPESHARDLESLLRARGVGSAHLVGWSTGAQVALRFASMFPERVRSATLLNGSYCLPEDVPSTEFRRNLTAIMPKIASSPAYAQIYHRMIYGNRRNQSYVAMAGRDGDEDRQTLSSMLAATDPFLLNLTSVPFRTAESLYRYACMMVRYLAGPPHAWTIGFKRPALVVTGDQDLVAHPEESVRVAGMLEQSRMLSIPEGDHFSLYNRPELWDAVIEFVEKVEATC